MRTTVSLHTFQPTSKKHVIYNIYIYVWRKSTRLWLKPFRIIPLLSRLCTLIYPWRSHQQLPQKSPKSTVCQWLQYFCFGPFILANTLLKTNISPEKTILMFPYVSFPKVGDVIVPSEGNNSYPQVVNPKGCCWKRRDADRAEDRCPWRCRTLEICWAQLGRWFATKTTVDGSEMLLTSL